jgi:hypothetical protein
MRAIVAGLISTIGCTIALFAFYPWSTYFGNFRFGLAITAGSYLIVALMTGIWVALTYLVLQKRVSSARLAGAICGSVLFGLLAACALLLGPIGLNVPGTRIRGIFFAEWKFLTFMGYIAPAVAVISAVSTALLLSNKTRRNDGT